MARERMTKDARAKIAAEKTSPDPQPIAETPLLGGAQEAPAVGVDVDGHPYCELHYCRLHNDGKHGATYYKCPVPGCGASQKRSASLDGIPYEPHQCPNGICGGLYLQIVEGKSDHSHQRIECPNCKVGHYLPRNHLVKLNRHLTPRRATANIGER